jgi:hypothetical protein
MNISFVEDIKGIMGVGVVRDIDSGDTALQSSGPSGMITFEDQNEYVYGIIDPNAGHAYYRSGDSLSGIFEIESVCAELYFNDGFTKKFSLSQPNERTLVSGYENYSVIGCFNEIFNKSAISASPGFTWGRKGTSNAGTWLLNDDVVSFITGRNFPLYNGELNQLSISNGASNTFVLGFYEHDKTTYTQLATVTFTAETRKTVNFTGVTVTKDKELACKIESGSCSDIVVQAILRGAITP